MNEVCFLVDLSFGFAKQGTLVTGSDQLQGVQVRPRSYVLYVTLIAEIHKEVKMVLGIHGKLDI